MPPAKRVRAAPDAPPDLLVMFVRAHAPALFYHVKRAHVGYRQEADLLDAHGADGGAPEALRAGFLLGVYGEASVTGKPYGGDIREGKRTVLVLTALANSAPEAATTVCPGFSA